LLFFRAANLPEEEKLAVLQRHQEHLAKADAGRKHYQELCEAAKSGAEKHYSFDFAQQVSLLFLQSSVLA
jgi:hypothetical protein